MSTALEPTQLQRQFCIELIKDSRNITDAYRRAAGPVRGAKQSAHKLINHPKMKEWIANHRLQLEEQAAYTLEHCNSDLEKAKLASANAGEFLAAVECQMRLHGLAHISKTVNSTGYTINSLRSMNDEQLIRLLGEDRIRRLSIT